jgi:hypothetical protein
MARTLDQILAELAPAFDPQVANIQKRQQSLPGQIQAEEQGLQARQTEAFDQILGGARRRGLGFSGIPLGEQAKYTATEFLPAMARLRQSGREQAMSLEDAILGIRERQRGQAQNIYQTEQDRAFQREMQERQLAEQRRAAAAQRAAMPSFGGLSLGGGQAIAQGGLSGTGVTRKADGGFAFVDASGRPTSAYGYAQQSGQDIRDVIYEMGRAGDTYAQQVYNQISRDPWFEKNLAQYTKLYSPLFWGGPSAPQQAATGRTTLPTSSGISNPLIQAVRR